MVLYERGEAFEYRNDYLKAQSDYGAAQTLLPLHHWKSVAEKALGRIGAKQSGSYQRQGKMTQWDVFHIVHTFVNAPDDLRFDSLSALQRMDSEPESALTSLRRCIESVENATRVRQVMAPAEVEEKLVIVRQHGNRAAHNYGQSRQHDVNEAVAAFVDVLEWADGELWLPQR